MIQTQTPAPAPASSIQHPASNTRHQTSKTIPLPPQIRLIKLFFRTVGRWVPGLAARLFWRLFTTPIKHSLKPPHKALAAIAKPLSFHIEAIPQGAPKLVHGYRWPAGPAAKRALLVHGWSGKALDFYKLIPRLTALGYTVDAIDLPSHGASPGSTTHGLEIAATARAYAAAYGVPDVLIGHSLGAAASTFGLSAAGLEVGILALIAAPVYLEHALDVGFTTLGVPPALQGTCKAYIERLLNFSFAQTSLINMPGPMPARRLLVLEVEHDDEIPAAHATHFLQRHPEAIHYLARGTTHNRVLKDEAALAWLEAQLA